MEQNKYDNLRVDVEALFSEFPISEKANTLKTTPSWSVTPWHKIYRFSLFSPKIRHNFWHVFRRSNIDQAWFESFKLYWSYRLKARPLSGVQDLYFLRGIYRSRFQSVGVSDTNDSSIHLKAWQRPEALYQLLHLVYMESLVHELDLLKLWKRYNNSGSNDILEFGSATAPVTTSLFEFYRVSAKTKIYISDIKTLAFHYAAYKFRGISNVIPITLEEKDDFLISLPSKVGAIFCITVMEHLNKPLETIKLLHSYLESGGVLIFDYIKSEGTGLDTVHALREREAVIDFIENNFSIVSGSLDKNASMPVTVARKL